MTFDFHCHLLPEMDDGADSLETSLQMLRMEHEQGVDCVIATPHFYRHNETLAEFLERRSECCTRLREAMPADMPQLRLGAEVAFTRGLLDEDITKLCIEGTKTMLLELPYERMSKDRMRALHALINKNTVKIVLAHVERYRSLWGKEGFAEIMALPVKKQINAGSLVNGGFLQRRWLLQQIADGTVHVIGTDAHNLSSRPVNFSAAMALMDKKGLSVQKEAMMRNAEKLTMQ